MSQPAPSAAQTVVLRFNREVIERGDQAAYAELLAPDFVNRTAPPGLPPGPEGMRVMFEDLLRPALPDLRVEIHDQITQDDKVVTRKTLRGTHRGSLFGVAPTGREIAVDVIDIVRVEHGRYVEHWGINTLGAVLQSLRSA